MKTKQSLSDATRSKLQDAHDLFDATKGLDGVTAAHKGKCTQAMKHIKDAMGDDGDDAGGDEGDYSSASASVKVKRSRAYNDQGLLAFKDRVTVSRPLKGLIKGLSGAKAEKVLKAYGHACEMANHKEMPRPGKSAMRECKGILSGVITAGDDPSPTGKPNPGAGSGANPMDTGKAAGDTWEKALSRPIGTKGLSPVMLSGLRDEVLIAVLSLPVE